MFLLACAALEGARDAIRVVPTLLKRGADPNASGTRHDHGADVPALCLVVGAMENVAEIIAASQAETPMEDDEKPMDDETPMEDENEPPPPERLSPASADDLHGNLAGTSAASTTTATRTRPTSRPF